MAALFLDRTGFYSQEQGVYSPEIATARIIVSDLSFKDGEPRIEAKQPEPFAALVHDSPLDLGNDCAPLGRPAFLATVWG